MGQIYYDQLADVLTAAGVAVSVSEVNAGWERRARSSGGFSAPPLGVVWHHTASTAAPESDLSWMIHGSDDAPIGNVLLARDGVVWPIAAGAANTQGKGGPVTLSRGTAGVDTGNSTLFAIEAANAGTGEGWPTAQVDAYFATSNALNAMFGNLPTDVITHALGAGDGWTSRKIDPATAYAVAGPWYPAGVTSSGTWLLADIRDECARRAGQTPAPGPNPPDPGQPPSEEDSVMTQFLIRNTETGQIVLLGYDGAGVTSTGLDIADVDPYVGKFGAWLETSPGMFDDLIRKSNEV